MLMFDQRYQETFSKSLYAGHYFSYNSVSPFLVGILETVWDKHSVTAATPPPSPTSGESGMVCLPAKAFFLNVLGARCGDLHL